MNRAILPRRTVVLLWLLLPALFTGDGAGADEEAGPSTQAVHQAISRGAAFLKGEFADGFEDRRYHDPTELVVLALHHAGANLRDDVYRLGLEATEKAKLSFTYRVSVMAMALSEINPRKYRARLAHCAQWLVDTQLAAGEWGYPGSISGRGRQPYPAAVAPPEPTPNEEAGADPVYEIARREDVPTFDGEKGDFSNTQFAILGLRACRDAGIGIPKPTWKAALSYLVKNQRPDGGWGYVYSGEQDTASYASLTCAGVCSVAICLHALGKRPASDRTVKKALAWLAKYWEPGENFGIDRSTWVGDSSWQYYHLYSVERTASVLGLKKIGDRPWYPAGARFLLGAQRADGSWDDASGGNPSRGSYLTVADTCFAILFLARATPPLTR